MKRLIDLLLLLSMVLILSACSAEPLPAEGIPVAATIDPQPSGGRSILIPPTLSPNELNQASSSAGIDFADLVLQNQSSWNICYVYIASPEETTWGKDWLGANQMIEAGDSFHFQVKAGSYDIRAENCDFTRLDERYKVQLSSAWTWTVDDAQVDFTDGFQENGSWSVKGSGAAGQVRSEAYYLGAAQKNALALAKGGHDLVDRIITVEARPVSPANVSTVAYGLMCRVQSNGDGYLFLARGDGMYSIQKVAQGERSVLVDWKASDQISSGSELTVIEVACDGDRLALRLNGHMVEKITDSSYGSGDIALSAIQLGNGAAEVQFDNLVVTVPSN